MLVASCQSNNIYSLDPFAHTLVNSFCMCPSARAVLADIGNKVSISVQTADFPHHRFAFDDTSNQADIQIPAKNLRNTEALSNLAFEIFNAKGVPNFQKLYNRAKEGNIGIEEYSKKFEIQEFESKKGYDALIKKCVPFFKIKPEPGTPDLEFQLWNHEINCHTDKIRERWIVAFQKNYCQKHPNDLKSCKIKKQDLCDFYKLHQLPEIERKIFITQRIFEKLPFASQKIQDFYSSDEGTDSSEVHDEL